jgi:hypothetical protein
MYCTLKYVPRILYGRLNTFCVRIRRKNEEYAERNFRLQQILGTSKGQHFKQMGGYIIVLA